MCEPAHTMKGRSKRTSDGNFLRSGRVSTNVSVSPQWIGAQSARHVLNGTARIARAAYPQVVSNAKQPESLSTLKAGDVLVSRPTAVREHEISIIPNAPHAILLRLGSVSCFSGRCGPHRL